jgi:hypothetical protein
MLLMLSAATTSKRNSRMPSRPIALLCSISRGGFSGERIVTISTDSGEYRGIAPTEYCWKAEGRGLESDEPAQGQAISGLVAALFFHKSNDNKAMVSVPDGSVFLVSRDIISNRPKIDSDVLV